jgi:hypothetical protein
MRWFGSLSWTRSHPVVPAEPTRKLLYHRNFRLCLDVFWWEGRSSFLQFRKFSPVVRLSLRMSRRLIKTIGSVLWCAYLLAAQSCVMWAAPCLLISCTSVQSWLGTMPELFFYCAYLLVLGTWVPSRRVHAHGKIALASRGSGMYIMPKSRSSSSLLLQHSFHVFFVHFVLKKKVLHITTISLVALSFRHRH